ncbi:MAG: hypothetical protein QW632_02940 [Ignisphaera sp.]
MSVIVVSDWDADGIVSAAEIVYSQETAGLYPIKTKTKVYTYPSTPKTILSLLESIDSFKSQNKNYVVILDIAFNANVDKFLAHLKNLDSYIVYVDHHLSTHIHYKDIEKKVNELIVGKSPVALLVYTFLRSLGIRLTPRIESFVNVVSAIEGGKKYGNEKLIKMLVDITKYISATKNKELWEKFVRWISSPLPHVAIPFQVNDYINAYIDKSKPLCNEKEIAEELAISSTRVFNYRVARIKSLPKQCRFSAIVSSLYRLLKSPTIVYNEEKKLVAIKTRDDKAFTISMSLYKQGYAEDVTGHERLAIAKLKNDIDYNTLLAALRRILIEVG